jgi:protein SCO1/2
MLMGLKAPLVEGESVTLTLRFESGTEVTVDAQITHEPIPLELEPDALTTASLEAVAAGTYVGQVIDPPIQVQDFEAPSSHADITRFSDTDGTWRVIFFGYMHCPDFCPLTLVDYKHAKAKLGDAVDDVTFVYVSVDAVRDTADALENYLANFDTAFVGYSADDLTLARIQPDYGFYYERRMEAGSQAVYTIDHSTRSYVVDRDGVLRTSFAYDTEPEAIASALRWYIEHENE